MTAQLRIEDQLCLQVAKGPDDACAISVEQALGNAAFDWELARYRAIQHGLAPALYRQLQGVRAPGGSLNALPEAARSELELIYHSNLMRNSFLADELEGLLSAMNERNIPAIPLKGLPLALRVHGNWDLRVCVDLDILVPRHRLGEAYDLLASRGYGASYSRSFLTDWVTRNTYEFQMLRPSREMVYSTELHCGLLWEGAPDSPFLTEVWRTAEDGSFLGAPCRRMAPETEFLFLVVHAARHNWGSLKWLADIHHIIEKKQLDWNGLREFSRRLGWIEVVGKTMAICQALFGTPVLRQFSTGSPAVLTPEIVRSCVTEPRVPSPLENTLLCLRLAGKSTSKFGFMMRRLLVPTPREAEICRLPGWLNFLYYLLRPLRLSVATLQSLLGSIRSKA